MNIRPCTAKDQDAWIQLNQEFMSYEVADDSFWNQPNAVSQDTFAKTFQEALASPEHITLWLIEEKGEGAGEVESIGFANLMTIYSVWAHGRALILDDLFLREAYRGQGRGKVVMAHLERYAKDQGYLRLQFQSESSNPDAHGFYSRLGYQSSDMHFYVKCL